MNLFSVMKVKTAANIPAPKARKIPAGATVELQFEPDTPVTIVMWRGPGFDDLVVNGTLRDVVGSEIIGN